MKKRIGQIDLDTGEVLNGEGVFAFVTPKRRNGFETRWFAMAQAPLEILAKADVSGETYRVLFMLLATLDFENLIAVNQSEIGRKINISQPNVNRSIRKLIALGVLLAGPRIGPNRSYRLNPRFGWKGSAKNHRQAMSDDLQQRMTASGITGVLDGGLPDGAAPIPRGSHGERHSQPVFERDPNTADMFEGMQP